MKHVHSVLSETGSPKTSFIFNQNVFLKQKFTGNYLVYPNTECLFIKETYFFSDICLISAHWACPRETCGAPQVPLPSPITALPQVSS